MARSFVYTNQQLRAKQRQQVMEKARNQGSLQVLPILMHQRESQEQV